ncbi:hypothetical protein WN55_02211 [Dufourea novaeangliae]|uniref:Uncharacterized protein n=1 Tax=Dufourea novaeangliae TaxID=178035 RepID=A0A154PFT1_DUFNO|nr:hypothetical protein WN55_02211 [Dufourea novaeangliae]
MCEQQYRNNLHYDIHSEECIDNEVRTLINDKMSANPEKCRVSRSCWIIFTRKYLFSIFSCITT